MIKISEYLDKTYVYIIKNFIRFGIVLLIIGILLMTAGILMSTNTDLTTPFYLTLTISGGFLFLSGSLFVIASVFSKIS